MAIRPSHLSDFQHPPIVEVALGVEFTPLQSMRQAHLGLYWGRIRSDYPVSEDHPALPPTPDAPAQFMVPAFRVNMPGTIPPNRTIFASVDKERLIQLQQDRFVTNWRGSGEAYPRFEALLEKFGARWADFRDFVASEQLGAILPTRVEVTYVNHMAFDKLADFLNLADNLDISVPGLTPPPSDIQLQMRYEDSEGGARSGSLQVLINRPPRGPFVMPGQVAEGWFLNFIFRAPILDPTDSESIFPLLTRGREFIDHAFIDLTRPEVQRDVWGKID